MTTIADIFSHADQLNNSINTAIDNMETQIVEYGVNSPNGVWKVAFEITLVPEIDNIEGTAEARIDDVSVTVEPHVVRQTVYTNGPVRIPQANA